MAKELHPFEKAYKRLNKAQRKAVDTIDGPLLVVAGPGSGKTEILSLRVANILKKTDIPASGILCLTFTDSAAVNMRRRLVEIIGADAYRVAIYTFHSFALSVMERFPEYFFGGMELHPADELVQAEILEAIFNNLSHDNPLYSLHPEIGYVYMDPVKQAISSLKKAGLTPEEFEDMLEVNKKERELIRDDVDRVFSATMSKKIFDDVEKLITSLKKDPERELPVPHFDSYTKALARSLTLALRDARADDSTKPLTLWKQSNTSKEGEKRVLKDEVYQAKMEALARVYGEYQRELHREGYVDFDDMLLSVVRALRENEVLRAELQERYLYMLVDEFQDTNDAQMRLLGELTDSWVHEGNPNIMAVGDDDQAIYKFQGAEISNILRFKETYPSAEVVTMTENYRSTQDVLNIARTIITQGEERLENLLPGIEKKLTASNKERVGGSIEYRRFESRFAEYEGVAEKVKNLIEKGESPQDIAVIARHHRDLEALVPYLTKHKIPLSYERQLNVFHEPHIHELIVLSKFVTSLARKNRTEADEYLPEILSFPFWDLSRKTVWNLSLEVNRSKPTEVEPLWLEAMLGSENEELKRIAEFLIDVGVRSLSEPAEYILERLIGAHIPLAPESDDDSLPEENFIQNITFTSPFKDYYFSRERFDENKEEYVRFLSALQTLIGALREYKMGSVMSLEDVVRFVELHELNNIPLNDTSPFSTDTTAVSLLSAHKAKGLEFKNVFVLSVVQDVWAGRSRGSLLPFPHNLPIAPSGDTVDDQLRLFYVALTRAKSNLFLSGYTREEGGKEVLPLEFLSEASDLTPQEEDVEDVEVLEQVTPRYHTPPFIKDEQSILRDRVRDYQLSVTHLNNFLDISRGGPQLFLEQNLLRFPQPMTISAVFGSLMHRILHFLHMSVKTNSKLCALEETLEMLRREVDSLRVSEKDRVRMYERGRESLEALYRERKDGFSADVHPEYNFKREGAVIEGVPLTGKIDVLRLVKGNEVEVCDYKTGKASRKWERGSLKLWRYRNQLIFYKLLVENSREFGGKREVRHGSLLFIEPDEEEIVELSTEIAEEEAQHLTRIIAAVHRHIEACEFPDTSHYPETLKGVEQFIEDLLAEKI